MISGELEPPKLLGTSGIAHYLGISEETIRCRIKRRQWDCLPPGMFKTSPKPHAEWRCPRQNVLDFKKMLERGAK
jgi:hypothetical protein